MKVDDEGGPTGITALPTVPVIEAPANATANPAMQTETMKTLGGLRDSIHAPTTTTVTRNGQAQPSRVSEVLRVMNFKKNKPAQETRVSRSEDEIETAAEEVERPPPPRPYTLIKEKVPIHFDSMVGPGIGIDGDQLEEFMESPGSIFFTVWASKVYDKGSKALQTHAETSIHAATGEEILLMPPKRSAIGRARDGPIAYLATGVSEEARNTLLEQGCYSMRSPQVTFFAHAAKCEFPRWICGLHGFWDYRNVDALREGIANQLTSDEASTKKFREIMKIIINSDESNLTTTDLDDAIAATVSTLEVKVLADYTPDEIEDFKLNIYLYSPTTNPAHYMLFRQAARDIKYYVKGRGSATQWYPPPCTGCHGADHPRGLCPFTTIPGWNGSLPEGAIKNEANRPTGQYGGKRRQGDYEEYDDRYTARGGRGYPRGGRDQRDDDRYRRMNDDRERRRDRDEAYDRQGRWRGRSRYD